MHRFTLALLIVVPSVLAAIATAYFIVTEPGQIVGIGTLAGVFVVAYIALISPWISGYLEDKRAHSVVLRNQFFGAFKTLDTGQPGITGNLDWRAQTLTAADEFHAHLPMEIRGGRTVDHGDWKGTEYIPLELSPAFPSAHSHMKAYPPLISAWDTAQEIKSQYNDRRAVFLESALPLARTRLAAAYPDFSEGRSDGSDWPEGPFYVPSSVVTHAYFFTVASEVYREYPRPEVQELHLTFGGRSRVGIGREAYSVELVSDLSEHRSPARMTTVLNDLSRDPSFVSGVRELCKLEDAGASAVANLNALFQELSTRIDLGHRIEGSCPETGY